MKSDLDALQQRLGHVFANAELLQQALTHASFGHEKRQHVPDNQRLEFLGDAVLQLVITEELYRRFPGLTEGRLTVMRAQLVNRHHLQAVALALGLGDHLILGRGEENSQGRQRGSILADAVEAVLGAVFAEAGWETARAIILRHFESSLAGQNGEMNANPKGELQEKLQSRGDEPPLYRCITESGPAHARLYEVVVEWQGSELGRGQGASKKEAEIRAAESALRAL
jgi:ribonuclease-3